MYKLLFISLFFVPISYAVSYEQSAAFTEKPKVTTEICGKLGNQMFMVAACIAYALDHDYEAIFPSLKDARYANLNIKYVFRKVNLEGNTNGFVKWEQKNRLKSSGIYESIPYYMDRPNISIRSYFQSEKYFAHHQEVIRELFSPDNELESAIRNKYIQVLSQPVTVGIHVRTFRELPPEKQKERWKGWSYYERAMNLFPEDTLFILCSDRPHWVARNFPKKKRRIIFINGNNHIWDFYLLSFCDHQIVSPTSSYSWWAAWLNDNPHKIVVAPEYFGWQYRKGKDAIPESWTTIPF